MFTAAAVPPVEQVRRRNGKPTDRHNYRFQAFKYEMPGSYE